MKNTIKIKKVVKNQDEMRIKTPIDNIKRTLDKVLDLDEEMEGFFDSSKVESNKTVPKQKTGKKVIKSHSKTKKSVKVVDETPKSESTIEPELTVKGTRLITVNVEDLKIHPEYSKIYTDSDDIDDIVESMDKDNQSFTPPIVTEDMSIVSGVRRFHSYRKLGVKRIQVLIPG